MARAALLALSLVAACGRTDAPAPPRVNADAAVVAPAPPPPPADPRSRMLIALAHRVAAECKCDGPECHRFFCPAGIEWNELVFERSDAATLVGFFADDSRPLWRLAAETLHTEDWLAGDVALQDAVLARAAALPKDVGDSTANNLGILIGRFLIGTPERLAPIAAIVADPDAPHGLRLGIVNWLLAGNPASEPIYQLTVDQAQHGATPAIRAAALRALSAAYNTRSTDEMCALWIAALPSLDDDTAAMIAAHLTDGDLQVNDKLHLKYVVSEVNKCPAATVDATLAQMAARVASHTTNSFWWSAAIEGPNKSVNATPAQRQQALAIATAYVADPALDESMRCAVFLSVGRMDPPTARAMAARYARAGGELAETARYLRKTLRRR